MDPNRRELLGTGVAAAGAWLLAANANAASPEKPVNTEEPAKMDTKLPSFRFAMEEQPAKVGEGGTAREASAEEFPVSKGIAGVSMRLEPGSMRELHWHANAAEWAYIVEGNCRITIYSPDGEGDTADFGPGDVWYFPRGFGHSIQGIGPGTCHFILVFDNGYFSEFDTFSFSDWLAHTPPEVLAKNLHMPVEALKALPTKEVYFAKGPVPPPLPKPARGTPPSPHRYALEAQTPRRFVGGDLRLVTAKEFPISTTMSGAVMNLDKGAIRELHWHPNANEWQYVLSGRMRMTVFASHGKAETMEFNKGDVGYVPQGFGHYLENIGDDKCSILLVFDAGEYQDLGLSGWIASNPQLLVATNLGIPESMVNEMPKRNQFITE